MVTKKIIHEKKWEHNGASVRKWESEKLYIYIFNIYKAKATAALGSFGNCSDALQRKDISKYSVGFIPDLSLMSKDALLKHLMSNGGRIFQNQVQIKLSNNFN